MSKFEDLTGRKFGNLTVLKKTRNKKNRILWLCKCSCGKESFVSSNDLKSGHTKSCGCLKNKITTELKKKHGLTGTRIYGIWKGMKIRCFNKKREDYKDYGGRGIKVCDEWKNDFKNFYDWSMLNGYKDGLTIDRVDVNGNYEPLNCRWVTRKIQSRNTRRNHFINFNGECLCLKDFCIEKNIKYPDIYRLFKMGKTIEDILKE